MVMIWQECLEKLLKETYPTYDVTHPTYDITHKKPKI